MITGTGPPPRSKSPALPGAGRNTLARSTMPSRAVIGIFHSAMTPVGGGVIVIGGSAMPCRRRATTRGLANFIANSYRKVKCPTAEVIAPTPGERP